MKNAIILFAIMLAFVACEENKYYEADPRFFNDAMHGNIIGKIKQIHSGAIVIVSQVNPIDTTEISSTDGSFEIANLPIGNYDVSIIAENYRIYKVCNVMVQGAGNTYMGEIDLSSVPDLVSSHYPEDKAEIVYNNRFSRLTISVVFTQPMDRESVEKAFSTNPPTEGIFHWGQYTRDVSEVYFIDKTGNWGYNPSATISTFSKITSFSYQIVQKNCYMDTTYTVKISTLATDTAGNHLRFPLQFSFSTVQSATSQNAIITSPSHGDWDVNLLANSGIQVTFPRNMDQASTESALKVEPSSNLIYIWPQKNQLTIYTGGIFQANKNYVITVDSTAKDLDGVKLGSNFTFSFNTAPVNVSSTSPRNGELFVSPTTSIFLYFNTYMQKSSVQSAFSITPAVAGTLDWYNDSKTTMKFIPSQLFLYNTKYTVVVGTQAKDIFGSPIKEPYSFSFIIRPE